MKYVIDNQEIAGGTPIITKYGMRDFYRISRFAGPANKKVMGANNADNSELKSLS